MAGSLSGPGAYITDGSATAAKLKGKVSWIAQKAGEGGVNLPRTQHPENGLDPSEIAKSKAAAGVPVWLWTKHEARPEDTIDAYQRTLELAQTSGAAGVIFSVSNAEELKDAIAIGKPSTIPKAIALTGPMLSQAGAAGVPADWQKVLFVDNMTSSAADDMTPEQLAQILKENPDIVTVLPSHGQTDPPLNGPAGELYNTGTPIDISKYLQVLQGNNNVAITHYEDATSTADQALNGRNAASPASNSGTSGSGAAGSGGSSGGHSNANPVKKVNEHEQTKKTVIAKAKGPGIEGPHQAAGAQGAPPAYKGGGWVVDDPKNKNDTFSFTDKKGRRVTITTTSTGAKVEQVAGGHPYQIQKPQTPTFAKDPNQPAWHQATTWTKPTDSLAQQGVLEQRPGANGNTVYRMDNGTYTVTTPDGASHPGGTWDKSQWPDGGIGALGTDSNTQQQQS